MTRSIGVAQLVAAGALASALAGTEVVLQDGQVIQATEVRRDGDMFLIGINDQLLYLLDSQHFLAEWMSSGFLDVSRWVGQEVRLSFGLLSESAGHSFTIGGYGLFSRERSVPDMI